MYHVFPYRSTKLSRNLLISATGEYAFCDDMELDALARKATLPEDLYVELKTKHFLCAENEIGKEEAIQAIRHQTKQDYLEATSILLMVVPTIECNCECVYCQVSSQKKNFRSNNMSLGTAYRFCEFALSLPHRDIKIEFQGGEPTLHMAAVQFIVKFMEKHKRERGKTVSYVICTNLLEADSLFAKLVAKYHIDVSTSLDGDRTLHERNRPSHIFSSTYSTFKENLLKLRANEIYPSALLTVTRHNIDNIERVIEEYIALEFRSVFIRQLNNYGYAYSNSDIQYADEEFMSCYETGLQHILKQNLVHGIGIREEWFAILLRKVMTPFSCGFVDLQNPTALARMCLLVNYNGSIYPSDEARMMAEMGIQRFLLGNLKNGVPYESMLACSPDFARLHYLDEIQECNDCPYQPYCGADPVRGYYAEAVSKESFCGKRKKMFDFLFDTIGEASAPKLRLFRSWAND